MINQAIAKDYALTGKNNLDYYGSDVTDAERENLFKNNLSLVFFDAMSNGAWHTGMITQDGLGYQFYVNGSGTFNQNNELSSNNFVSDGCIVTNTKLLDLMKEGSWWDCPDTPGSPGNLTGAYRFICSLDRCIPDENTAAIINSSDPTKAE